MRGGRGKVMGEMADDWSPGGIYWEDDEELYDEDRGCYVWRTKDGELLRLPDMKESHIRNCIGMLERNGDSSEWLTIFNLELSRIKEARDE